MMKGNGWSVNGYTAEDDSASLAHYGVKGMKWKNHKYAGNDPSSSPRKAANAIRESLKKKHTVFNTKTAKKKVDPNAKKTSSAKQMSAIETAISKQYEPKISEAYRTSEEMREKATYWTGEYIRLKRDFLDRIDGISEDAEIQLPGQKNTWLTKQEYIEYLNKKMQEADELYGHYERQRFRYLQKYNSLIKERDTKIEQAKKNGIDS